jgi:hypothetical protein
MPLQKYLRDEHTAQQFLIDVKTPLIRGAVPLKPSPRELVEPEGPSSRLKARAGVQPCSWPSSRHRLSAIVGTSDHKRDIPMKLDRLRPSPQNQNIPSRRPHSWWVLGAIQQIQTRPREIYILWNISKKYFSGEGPLRHVM